VFKKKRTDTSESARFEGEHGRGDHDRFSRVTGCDETEVLFGVASPPPHASVE